MDLSKISAGEHPPEDIYVVVEVPMNAAPVKYEMDKDSGALFVDRFLSTAMFYPANYGFIPHTLSGDGDPCDALVLGQIPVLPGAVLRARPIGALAMKDESGEDEKILCVPHEKLHSSYENCKSHEDLPSIVREQIVHFFEHYKDLEKNKWVTIRGWESAAHAHLLIEEALKRAS